MDEESHSHTHAHFPKVASIVGLDPEDGLAEESLKEERGKSLGVKSIGPLLSFIYAVNQIFGPGVLAIPLVYEQSGLIPTMFMVTFFFIVSSLASTCLAQAIASIPDNRQYQQRVEFGTAVAYYYGHKWHVAFQVCMNITVQAYNIASIVICAQSLDQAFVSVTGKMYAFEFGPDFGFHSYASTDPTYTNGHVALTLGYLLITLFFMPAGFLNLNDNVKTVQVGSFVFLIILVGEFVGYFFWRGADLGFNSIPAFGNTYTQLVSVFIFSWAYVIFIPSWLNEKSVDTSVNKVIWSSGFASWLGYVSIGALAATVFTLKEIGDDNMLTTFSTSAMPIITRITSHLFALGVIAPGIPVCAVTCRYNLFVGNVCSKKASYFWGCIAPWIVGWIFCQGEVFANLLSWTSLLFGGMVNFLIPFVMYLTSLRVQQVGGAPVVAGAAVNVQSAVINAATSPLDTEYSVDVEDDRERLASMVSAYSAPATTMQQPLLEDGPSSPGPNLTGGVPLGSRSDTFSNADRPSVHFCSPVQDGNYSHGPVYPLPKAMQPYAYQAILALTIVTQVIISAQIITCIYYAAIGQNLLH